MQFDIRSIVLGLVVVCILSCILYTNNENRKAYYACLKLSEKLAEQQKQPDGGVRIVSLPYCRT
jgi:hypothetical protein